MTAHVDLSDAAFAGADPAAFNVHLDEFDGPFDLLLALISKHKLEVTELALHQVTDEFCSYIRSQGSDWNLDEASSFLVIAATLLDLKAARLLPSGEVENTEDLALLEARDLLFARLLQYRAFKEVSALFEQQLVAQSSRLPRPGGLDPEFARLLPDVVLSLGADRFAALASVALTP
ncbi:MAG: segregation/condensation protein A, partial [Actinomycetes bacterium]